MEAKSVTALPADPGWQFEPKWDGFRCLAVRDSGETHSSPNPARLGCYFPEVLAHVAALRDTPFILDGELVILTPGNGPELRTCCRTASTLPRAAS